MKHSFLIFLCILLLLPSVSCRRAKKTADDPVGMTAEEIHDLNNPKPEAELVVDGVPYARKAGVSTLLFMGIDIDGTLQSNESLQGGQSDTLLLMVNDSVDKVQTILQIDRDTMTEVEILDAKGRPTDYSRVQQICLSHAYGPGDEISCENTVKAVRRLLRDMPVDGYIALMYDAIPGINDEAGGITVKIEDDFTAVDPALVEGETVTLRGLQALHYLRGRKRVADGTNRNRMSRQRTYMNAFGEKARSLLKSDGDFINRLYDAALPYMVTDMTLGEISAFAAKSAEYKNGGILTPPGVYSEKEYANGNTYAEFVVDEDGLLGQILKLFYMPLA